MATVYRAPINPPDVYRHVEGEDYKAKWARIEREEQEYVERLQAMAKRNGSNPALGMKVSFPYADGFAQYILWKVKPLQLVHVAIGDAWDLPDYVTRGIRLSDITARAGRMPAGGPVD